MGCGCCDLNRIYKQFQEKAKKKAEAEAAAKAAEINPVAEEAPVAEFVQPKLTKTRKKKVAEPITEGVIVENIQEASIEEIMDAE